MNNVVEADLGKLKQLIRPVRGFKTLKTAYASSRRRDPGASCDSHAPEPRCRVCNRARQTTIRVTSSHAKAEPAARALAAVAAFLRGLARNAEQLTRLETWRAILSRAFQAFLNGRLLRAPPRLAPA